MITQDGVVVIRKIWRQGITKKGQLHPLSHMACLNGRTSKGLAKTDYTSLLTLVSRTLDQPQSKAFSGTLNADNCQLCPST